MTHHQHDPFIDDPDTVNPILRLYNTITSLNIRARWNGRQRTRTIHHHAATEEDEVEFRRT
jgi:hypothetical protein